MAAFEQIFRALNDAGVRYVTVGGVAVVLHGHARLTTDLDLAIDLAAEPSAAAIQALESLGFRPRLPVKAADFADPAIRQRWIEEKSMEVFTMWDPEDPTHVVDLFVTSPIDFDELWERSVPVDLEVTQVLIASIPDLIRMKSATDRPLDREDIVALKAILESKEKGR
ncbi:MAG: DUF6036 family nucleotidyltransferase [Actinomycetota bacterium]